MDFQRCVHSRQSPVLPDVNAAENNKGRDTSEVDLHGLKVKEAIERTDNAIVNARQNGLTELRLIVGMFLWTAIINIKESILMKCVKARDSIRRTTLRKSNLL